RSSAVPEDGCHRRGVLVPQPLPRVAILSRPGGRLPRSTSPTPCVSATRCDPQPSRRTAATPTLSASSVQKTCCCDPQPSRRTAATPTLSASSVQKTCCCDPQPSRRTAATSTRPVSTRPSTFGCDPQPSRRTAATSAAPAIYAITAVLRSSAVPED